MRRSVDKTVVVFKGVHNKEDIYFILFMSLRCAPPCAFMLNNRSPVLTKVMICSCYLEHNGSSYHTISVSEVRIVCLLVFLSNHIYHLCEKIKSLVPVFSIASSLGLLFSTSPVAFLRSPNTASQRINPVIFSHFPTNSLIIIATFEPIGSFFAPASSSRLKLHHTVFTKIVSLLLCFVLLYQPTFVLACLSPFTITPL
jgi:hypothetical protein